MKPILISTTSAIALLAIGNAPASAAAVVSLVPSTLAFGTSNSPGASYTLVGTTSKSQTVSLTNNGANPVSGSFGSASGMFSGLSKTFSGLTTKSSALSNPYAFTPTAVNLSSLSTYAASNAGKLSQTLTASGKDTAGSTFSKSFTLVGIPVAPIVGITVSNPSTPILVGNSFNTLVTISNLGNGNLAGPDSVSLRTNLHGGTTGVAAGLEFSGAGGTFNLLDAKSTKVASPNTQTYSYLYKPADRGTDSATITTTTTNGSSDGKNLALAITTTLTGKGVAPVESTVATAAGLTRIGTTSTAGKLTVTNTGDGNMSGLGSVSNLKGTISSVSTPNFALTGTKLDLKDGVSATTAYSYKATVHGVQTAADTVSFSNGSSDNTNQAQAVGVTLSGIGVGPVYQSRVYGTSTDFTPSAGHPKTVDFGILGQHTKGVQKFDVRNTTTDLGGLALTGLTIKSITFGGADALLFALDALSGAHVGSILAAGDLLTLSLDFLGATVGLYSADVLITTDQGVAYGASGGASFDYGLVAQVVPKPVSWAAFGVGILGLAFVRRLRPARRPV